jgi:hypothetical protein
MKLLSASLCTGVVAREAKVGGMRTRLASILTLIPMVIFIGWGINLHSHLSHESVSPGKDTSCFGEHSFSNATGHNHAHAAHHCPICQLQRLLNGGIFESSDTDLHYILVSEILISDLSPAQNSTTSIKTSRAPPAKI